LPTLRFLLHRDIHKAGRELLNHSESVRTVASETVRSGVTQAILVAEVKNSRCGGTRLIDFIFNREGDGWRLFSVP